MKFWLKTGLIAFGGFGLGFAAIYQMTPSSTASADRQAGADGTPRETTWNTLAGLDFRTGKLDKNVKEINGAKVRVPGFMVPLEDNESSVSEFLLVPNPQACIHVPPPPPNQMVHVRMASGKKTKIAYGPVWVQGRLLVSEVDGPYGKSSYSLVAESTEPMR